MKVQIKYTCIRVITHITSHITIPLNSGRDYSYFNGMFQEEGETASRRLKSKLKCVEKWMMALRGDKDKSENTFLSTVATLQDVPTDPENKRDCLCCASARHPSSIYFFVCVRGGKANKHFSS